MRNKQVVAAAVIGLLLAVLPNLPSAKHTGERPPTAVVDHAEPEAERPSSDDPEAIAITFADLVLPIEADQLFEQEMLTTRAKELDGKRERIDGIMYPTHKRDELSEFVLLGLRSNFGPGMPADTVLTVKLRSGITTSYPGDRVLSVEGVLRVNPFEGPDGNTWSIYDLDDASSLIVKPHGADLPPIPLSRLSRNGRGC